MLETRNLNHGRLLGKYMASISEHYDNFLADYYTWMFDNTESRLEENRQFF